jgi:3-oxoacyl-[acyl-carrier protein] reductase
MLLQHRVVLVTGAANGIGLAMTRLFAREGARVVMTDWDAPALESARRLVLEQQPDADLLGWTCDVRRPDRVSQVFRHVFHEMRRLDVLVSNAGVLGDGLIGMVTEEQLRGVFETNVYGVMHCAQYASRMMARNGGGSIINIASIFGTNGEAGQSVYGGSKAAVVGITRSLAKELAPSNIRVNAIAPGFIDTRMAHSVPPDKFRKRLESIAMGRIGQAEEVAKAALFLASDLSSYVTGQVLGVDGGMLV